jgi:acyl dehydratase
LSAVAQVAERLKQDLGSKREEYLGEITRLLIRRYALSIGDDNPLYHDEEFARGQGYEDIVAPPNMLASIIDWGVGAPESDLRRDGTSHGDETPAIEEEGVRVMGGGEKMRFHKPVVAGTEVKLTSKLTDVSTKEGRRGLLTLLVFDNTYTDQHGDVLCVCTRTVIVR